MHTQTARLVRAAAIVGAVLTVFDAGMTSQEYVRDIAVQSDGSLVIAGSFDEFAGNPWRNLVRLHSDGSLDTTFDLDLRMLGR
jgi:hypothetical protein